MMRTVACLLVTISSAAHAEPTALATCGADKLELVASHVRARVTTPKGAWRFEAGVALARAGSKTRTLALEAPRAAADNAAYATMPSQLFVDLFVADGKVQLRHASEGAPDPAIALDLAKCTFAADLDAVIARLAPPEPAAGCTPDALRTEWLPKLAPLKLPAADADREARSLCEDHQQTIASRAKLEQRLSDAIAKTRTAARGAKLARAEETRTRAWEAIDGCVAKIAAGTTVAALHAAETKLRACYDRAAQR